MCLTVGGLARALYDITSFPEIQTTAQHFLTSQLSRGGSCLISEVLTDRLQTTVAQQVKWVVQNQRLPD